MPVAGSSHDITIVNNDGTTNLMGFMLARDKKGQRGFVTKDAQTIAPRILTQGEIDQASLPPDIALTWYQDDWVNGIGGESFRYPQDRQKLASSLFMDATLPRRLRQSRVTSATTNDVDPATGPSSGFALVQPDTTGDPVLWSFQGRSIYSWSNVNNSWTKGTNPAGTNHSATSFFKNGISFGVRTYVPAWDRTNEWLPGAYIYNSQMSAAEIAWTASTQTMGLFKFFAKTKNQAGNEVLWGGFNVYDSTVTVDASAYNSSVTTINANADPTTVINAGDIIVIGTEKMLVTAVANPALTVVRGFDSNNAGGQAILVASSPKIYIYGPHVIRSSTNPINGGSWSSPATIGNNDYPITALVADGDSLLVCKADGVWGYFPDGTTENLTKEFTFQRHVNNFIGAYNWNGHILLPLGYGGLLDLYNGTISDISFRLSMPGQTQYHGRVVAITGSPTSVYVMVQDTTNLKWATFEGRFFDGIFHWHHISSVTYSGTVFVNQCALLVHYSNSGLNANAKYSRIWIGINSNSVISPGYGPYYTPFGNISDDKNDGFAASGPEAVTVKYDGNLPRVVKRFASLDIESENLAGTVSVPTFYFEIDYRLDNATAWIALAALNTSPAVAQSQIYISPFQTVTFPAGITGKVIELRFRPFANGGTVIPTIKSFRLTSQLRPGTVPILPLTLYLSDQQMLLNGTIGGNPKAQLAQLNTWDQQAAEVTVVTPDRTSRKCVFLPGQLESTQIASQFGRRPEYSVKILLAAVDTTVVAVSGL